ncbi:MAG TPA: hypothetical protein VH854_08505 [Thermoanaerobaculia bacterium]|nr:hypothetical protein [Thermoanaerobaculia bacterium]
MFLLTSDAHTDACRRTLERMRRSLEPLAPGPIVLERIGSRVLGWFRARQSDNLHVFRDGCVVGKLVPGEAASDVAIRHAEALPDAGHPLARSVAVQAAAGGTGQVRVVPRHCAGAFFDGEDVSDMQLLLADLRGRRPAPESVALLASVGYFPGDLTLFREVRRVPFLHALEPGRAPERFGRLPMRASDDAEMVRRLVAILPRPANGSLAISGGCDSRFVLGLLLRAGNGVELVRLADDEDAVARRLAGELALPLRIVDAAGSNLAGPLYALMTDGQIYSGGGHYWRLRSSLRSASLLYLGLFADSILKNAFRAAWKNPLAGGSLEERLIRDALLSRMRSREAGLRSGSRRDELAALLRTELAGTWEHGELASPKQRANWFYYVHRGLRWTAAHTADVDFFAEVVLPLSDLEATASGLRSSAWSNFHNARVRTLNRSLLPAVETGYANGQSARVARGPEGAAGKLFYEFGARGLAHLRSKRRVGRAPAPPPAAGRPASSSSSTGEEARGLSAYFDRSLAALLADSSCSAPVRRAAVTVNEVLRYLDGESASAAAGVGAAAASGGGPP